MALLLDWLSTAGILFIVASGLLMIFGVMKIINFAHGALLTLGGYTAYVVTQLDLAPWLSWPLALFTGILVGMLIEQFVMRPLYKRPLDAILATWGLSIIIGQLIVMTFGREVKFADTPLPGTWSVAGMGNYHTGHLGLPFAVDPGGGRPLRCADGIAERNTVRGENPRRHHERATGERFGHQRRAHPLYHLQSGCRSRHSGRHTHHSPVESRPGHGHSLAGDGLHAGDGFGALHAQSYGDLCGARGLPDAGKHLHHSGAWGPFNRCAFRAHPAHPA